MVIGTGLIATVFNNQYKDNNSIIIFASGVSNSKENNNEEYDKELKLLEKHTSISFDKKLIYFSTCSIEDKSLSDSKYIQHKINIENYIKENFNNYLIFRLPIIIGNTKNKNTFFNFFKYKILNKEKITIQKNAYRYLIDVDDLILFLPIFIDDKKQKNKTINICFNNKMKVSNIIETMEEILNITSEKEFTDEGSGYNPDNNLFLLGSVYKSKYEYNPDIYNFNLLKKYLV